MVQGNCGEYTHQSRCTAVNATGETFQCGDLRYAYDFSMPIAEVKFLPHVVEL